jgi:hypothetical protein
MAKFALTSTVRKKLCAVNHFSIPDVELIFFGIRGALPIHFEDYSFNASSETNTAEINYTNPRCTLMQWQRATDHIVVFPESTVPHKRLIAGALRKNGTLKEYKDVAPWRMNFMIRNQTLIDINKIILLCLIIFSISAFGQVGPNLTAGAEGLAYKQGELDAQLILDIVATKKGEIKTELGKRLVLSKLEGGSYAFYHYAEKSLGLLFSQANKRVITKEFMTNSAELLLVYGLAEYMLSDIAKRKQAAKKNRTKFSLSPSERSLIRMFYVQVDTANKKMLKKYLFDDKTIITSKMIFDSVKQSKKNELKNLLDRKKDSVEVIKSYLNKDLNTVSKNFDRQAKDVYLNQFAKQLNPDETLISSPKKYLAKPEITKYLDNKGKKYMESRNDYYTPMSMFVDMIYDVCINNQNVKDAGMFQNSYSTEARYKALNKYLYFDKPNSKFIFDSLAGYRPKVDSLLNYLFTYYNLFKEISVIYSDSNALNSKAAIAVFDHPGVEQMIQSLKGNLAGLAGPTGSSESDAQYEDEQNVTKFIQNLPSYMPAKSVSSGPDIAKDYLDLAYQIKKEIMPVLATLNSRSNRYTPILVSINHLHEKLMQNGMALFSENQGKIKDTIFDLNNYLLLIDIINNLDQVESYDKIFKFLTGLMETFGDPCTQAIVHALTTGVDRYSAINTEENKIDIDVEGIAARTYERFAKNQHARVSMLFTVGVNQNIANGKNFRFINSDSSRTGVSQFVSEKIGIKWNVIDWNRRRSFSYSSIETEGNRTRDYKRSMHRAAKQSVDPVVNNFHLMVYGSGLLYRINALNSTDKFVKPIFGAGAGITFFNGLDFSISYASVNNLKFDESLWSISFDINIVEYLSALKKKKSE